MPRFYFDIDVTGQVTRDEGGEVLGGPEAARLRANERAHAVARDAPREGEWTSIVCRVRDERSMVLYTVSVTVIGRWENPASEVHAP